MQSTCAATDVGNTCTVTCQDGYVGDSADYVCQMVNRVPTFVPKTAEASCVLRCAGAILGP
jgi:hypothetical protein